MHRRNVVLGLLAVPAIAFAGVGCGGDDKGGGGDKDQLTKIINEGSKDPKKVCDHLSKDLLKQIGGMDGCQKAAATQKGGDTKITSLTINGTKATAKVSDKDGPSTIQFTKEGGEWVVSG